MDSSEFFGKHEYIFSDFDGTISKYDVIHAFITTFSKGDWTIAEEKWCKGELSTKDCLKIQFDLITGLKKPIFDDFINSIEIDPYFLEFYELTRALNKKIIILSDGFDVFIKPTLKRFKIDIPVYSNSLILSEKNGFLTFDMEYPNISKTCLIGSGCCKCEVARKFSQNYTYIGDGLSDRCIAKKSGLLFAKKSLETFCKQEKIFYFPYKTFQDIINTVCKEKFYAADGVRFTNGNQNQRIG